MPTPNAADACHKLARLNGTLGFATDPRTGRPDLERPLMPAHRYKTVTRHRVTVSHGAYGAEPADYEPSPCAFCGAINPDELVWDYDPEATP